jgi:hypothetical protein
LSLTNQIVEEFSSVQFQPLEKISIYPNPTESTLFFKGLALHDVLRVYDMKGQIVDEIRFSSAVNEGYDLVNSGIYIIKVIRNQELVYLCKAIRY